MYKEKRYHGWFSYLILLYSFPTLVIYLVFAIFVLPQLHILYKSLNVAHPSTVFIYAVLGAFSLISLLEIIFGIHIWMEKRSQTGISKGLLRFALLLVALNFFAGVLSFSFTTASVINPIYTLMQSFSTATPSTVTTNNVTPTIVPLAIPNTNGSIKKFTQWGFSMFVPDGWQMDNNAVTSSVFFHLPQYKMSQLSTNLSDSIYQGSVEVSYDSAPDGSWTISGGGINKNINLFNSIISSFRIINASSSANIQLPTEWNNYTDSKYHYQIQYPSTWRLDLSGNSKIGDVVFWDTPDGENSYLNITIADPSMPQITVNALNSTAVVIENRMISTIKFAGQ